MSTQTLIPVAAASIERGPIPFELYTSGTNGRLVLFARPGLEITDHHLELLKASGRTYFIRTGDFAAYTEYAFNKLGSIVKNPNIRVEDKTRILHEVGKRSVKKLLDDPMSDESHQEASTVIEHYVSILIDTPDAAPNLFALSAMDAYTYSHSINVATLNMLLAQELHGVKDERMWRLGMAGILHDIGKTRCDQEILFKPDRLTDAEFEHVKQHAVFSYDMLEEKEYAEDITIAGRNHHERMDGRGYPDKQTGVDGIAYFARVTAVADVYDAITSRRVYKDERPHLDALEIMANDKGHFDKEIFNALLSVVLKSEKAVNAFKQILGGEAKMG
jgi:putative nucleotidyltransferase with HDIG domain